MKQRISKRLVTNRYSELRKSGMTKDQATMRIGQLTLIFYDIEWTDSGRVLDITKQQKEYKFS